MKQLVVLSAVLLFANGFYASTAEAVVAFDQNVTNDVIFGSGNANGAWTTDRANGVELGLRAKVRFNGSNLPENTFNSDGAGTYSFDKGLPPTGFGFAPGSPSTAKWNFEWSINSNHDGTGVNLDGLNYELKIDFDRTAGTNFLTFDPINAPYFDHGIGTNATGNGGGTVAADGVEYAALIANNNLAQNSWNMEFFDDGGTYAFSGDVSGIYTFELNAYNGAIAPGNLVASSAITVNAVPEPSAFLFGGIVCGVIGFTQARKRRRAS